MHRLKKAVISLTPVLLFSYIGVCAYFYVIQEAIIFHPSVLHEDASYNYTFPFEERWFEPEEDVRIQAVHAFADSSQGLVIYFHGNHGNNRTRADKYELFLNNGYDVLYPDYRGYGKSRGELDDQEDLVGDMKFVFKQMAKEYNMEEIVLVGYSLGSGVAAQVAADFDPQALVLWTPFYSLLDMKEAQFPFLPDFLVQYPMRTDLALQKIEEPVHIFYAGEDEVLPIERSTKLNKFLKEGDSFTIIEGQGHGWIYQNRELVREMDMILE